MALNLPSLIPRPFPDFISQLWRKSSRKPVNITTSWTGNGGLGYYIMLTWFSNNGNMPMQYTASTASDRGVNLARDFADFARTKLLMKDV